jgi:CheY-like chemotaxis protein
VAKLKVLVVDDDPVAVRIARAALSSLGHSVVAQHGAFGTSAAIVREQPDLV